MTILDSLDGGYILMNQAWNGDNPPMPGGEGLRLGSADDIVCVTTFGTWDEVRIDLSVRHDRFVIHGPSGWEAVAETTVNVSGPLRVCDLEFEPHGESIELPPGTYVVQVFARSAEYVRGFPQLQIDDRPMEQHMVKLSLAGSES